MNTERPTVRCPACQRPQQAQRPNTIYFCRNCNCQFDDDPDEGGDYLDSNPAARLERTEHPQRRKGKRC